MVPLGQERQLCQDSQYKSTDQRVETGDASMAREVTSVKTPHTETISSESHQAHDNSDGARSAKREEETRRSTSRKHACPKLKLITRSSVTDGTDAKIERTPLIHEAK